LPFRGKRDCFGGPAGRRSTHPENRSDTPDYFPKRAARYRLADTTDTARTDRRLPHSRCSPPDIRRRSHPSTSACTCLCHRRTCRIRECHDSCRCLWVAPDYCPANRGAHHSVHPGIHVGKQNYPNPQTGTVTAVRSIPGLPTAEAAAPMADGEAEKATRTPIERATFRKLIIKTLAAETPNRVSARVFCLFVDLASWNARSLSTLSLYRKPIAGCRPEFFRQVAR
jgi:hypothetical protein